MMSGVDWAFTAKCLSLYPRQLQLRGDGKFRDSDRVRQHLGDVPCPAGGAGRRGAGGGA